MWNLTHEEGTYGQAKRALKGHSHFVQDVVISSDGQFALSGGTDQSVPNLNLTMTCRQAEQHAQSSCCTGSWDGTLRLWDLNSGNTTRRFIGHSKDVLSVAFSVDNRQVRDPGL